MTPGGSRCAPIRSARDSSREAAGTPGSSPYHPPSPKLPALICRNDLPKCQPGRRLSTSRRPCETPNFRAGHPRPASLPAENFCSMGRAVDCPDTDGDERAWGVVRGGVGDDGEVSPTPPQACFPSLSSPYTRRGSASGCCRHRSKPGIRRRTRLAAAWLPDPAHPHSTTRSDKWSCETAGATIR
jgi:hypothetical protein